MPSKETFLLADPEPANRPREDDPAQRMLDWLLRWPRNTVSSKEICVYGPRPKQKVESVIKTAEILVRHGWLTPLKMHRRDMKHWQIIRRPFVHPTVDG